MGWVRVLEVFQLVLKVPPFIHQWVSLGYLVLELLINPFILEIHPDHRILNIEKDPEGQV